MVAAASTITEERLQTVDFSDPYFNSRQGLSVNTNETPDITSLDDIQEGDVVGVQKGTTGKAFAEEELGSKGVEIKTFEGAPAAFTDLEGGAIVAVINDEGSSIAEVEQRPGLEVVEAIDTDEKYGFAFSKDNPELTEAVNGVGRDHRGRNLRGDLHEVVPRPPGTRGVRGVVSTVFLYIREEA